MHLKQNDNKWKGEKEKWAVEREELNKQILKL